MDVTRRRNLPFVLALDRRLGRALLPSLRRFALSFMLPSYGEKARAERKFPACGLVAAVPTKSMRALPRQQSSPSDLAPTSGSPLSRIVLNADGLIARGIVRRRQSTHGSSRITDELRSLRRTTCIGDSTGTGEKWYSAPEDSSFSRLFSPRVCSIFFRQEHEAAFGQGFG